MRGGEVAALEGALLGEELVARDRELSPCVEDFGRLRLRWDEGGLVSYLVMKALERRGSTSGPGRPWSCAFTLHGRDGFPYW